MREENHMVSMSEERVDGIPTIHAYPTDREGQPLPTVFFFHGFASSKALNAPFSYMLAKAGFRVVMPEARMHGARFGGDEALRLSSFWEIIVACIDELSLFREHYARRGLIADDRIGVGGTSMGGFVALGSLAHYSWIMAAASYMGSAYFRSLSRTLNPTRAPMMQETLHAYDPSRQIERLAARPLFVWHGEQDDIVNFDESLRLRDALSGAGQAGNLTFVSEAKGGHKVSMASVVAGVDFFLTHL